MSYNGSGTFQINTAGQPVVAGTVISSTAFNALTADLATGLSTAITKDGQTATTVRIPFAQGINSSLTTDSSSTSTGSIITAGGIGVAKALFVGTTANVAGAVTLQGALGVTGVTTVQAGTALLPAITTTGDTNTGIFFPAADTIAFSEGGAEAMRIDSDGDVGIGTTTPNSKLTSQTASTSTSVFSFANQLNNSYASNDSISALGFHVRADVNATGVGGAIAFSGGGTSDGSGNLIFCIKPTGNIATVVAPSDEKMRITASGNLQFNSGYGSVATAFGCRAWVNFNGTGTVAIRGSGNVSSITDNGTGDYTVNFTTAMADANYAVCGSAFGNVIHLIMSPSGTYSTTAVQIITSNTVAVGDNSIVAVAIFR